MPNDMVASANRVYRGGDILRASPRAKRAARETGIDLTLLEGTGPLGRIVEADVLRFAELQRREGPVSESGADRVRATPSALKLAAERGLSLDGLVGTGPGGRVTKEDVLAAISTVKPGDGLQEARVLGVEITAKPEAKTAKPSARLTLEAGLTGHVVPLNRKRAVTAQKMSLSAHSVARITLSLEADMAEAVRLREQLLPLYESQYGVRLSYNDLLILAVGRALREHPYLNARWTEEGILLIDQVNIGLAMAVSDGLIVPVVKDAGRRALPEIARTTADLVAKGREDKLAFDEITGGTFTITNLGMYGIEVFTPIVNPPEVAILGVGKIVEKPVMRDGQVVGRPRMALSLSVDHRVVDGSPAAQFLARVQQLLEAPYLLL